MKSSEQKGAVSKMPANNFQSLIKKEIDFIQSRFFIYTPIKKYTLSPVLIHPFCEVAMIDPKITPTPKTVSDNVVWSKMPIEEALRICRGTMTKEESDRLDAETPPFVAETDPRRMTVSRRQGPLLKRPAFDP